MIKKNKCIIYTKKIKHYNNHNGTFKNTTLLIDKANRKNYLKFDYMTM